MLKDQLSQLDRTSCTTTATNGYRRNRVTEYLNVNLGVCGGGVRELQNMGKPYSELHLTNVSARVCMSVFSSVGTRLIIFVYGY